MMQNTSLGGRTAVQALLTVLLLLGLTAEADAASSRGIQRIIRNPSGESVGLYTDSHALVISAGRYEHWPSLASVPAETDEVVEGLEGQGFDVKRVDDPNSRELRNAYEDFISRYGFDPDNRLLFFFSGHGHTRLDGKKGYLVPVDAPDPTRDERGFLRKAISMTQVLAWARRIESKHALFLFDSCFSGTVFETKSLPNHPPHITSYTDQPVRQFITAGSAGEEVPARSVFTPSFIRALRGEGDMNRDGYITGTELGMYLREKVLYYRTGQTPQFGKILDPDLDEGDFVFFLADSSGGQVVRPGPGKLVVKPDVQTAEVWINGHNYGRTRTFRIQEPGTFQVAVKAEGYQPYEVRVDVDPGETRTLNAYLEPEAAVVPVEPVQPVRPVRDEPEAGEIWREPTTGMEFVWVPGGTFEMGCGSWTDDCDDDEKPVHNVTLDGFWMGRYEVTVGQWKQFVSESGYGGDGENRWRCDGMADPENFSQEDDHPVACVSWKEADAFADWLSRKSGKSLRLPTEAEWEYAARSGGKPQKYAGGDNIDAVAWYRSNSGGRTHRVGTKAANGLGIHDMSGNVWEWCQDWKGDYSSGHVTNPTGPSSGPGRVLRGGGWFDFAWYCRSAYRFRDSPVRRNNYGFRLVLLAGQ